MDVDFDREDITELLQRWGNGDDAARNALFNRLYGKMLSAAQSDQGADASVVHDAFLRLSELKNVTYRDRTHFAGAWATTMRNIMIDRYRRRAVRQRAEGDNQVDPILNEQSVDQLDVARAMTDLAAGSERGREAADALALKLYGGLAVEEIASLTNRSVATIGRQLHFARFFLKQRLHEAQARHH